MKVHLDQDKCCGSGQCVLAAPGVFDLGEDDGLAVLLTDSPASDRAADVRSAAAACPTLAIVVDD
jgi:ferredoxin